MEFLSPIGFYSFEKEQKNKFLVSIEIEGDFYSSMSSDKLSDTLDYQEIYTRVSKIMEEPRDLIESLAEKIFQEIMTLPFPMTRIKIKVEKLNPPLKGKVGSTIFELKRKLTTS